MPKKHEDLLVYTKDGSFYFADYHNTFESIEGGCTILGLDDDDDSKVVTHWVYISQIPKPRFSRLKSILRYVRNAILNT